MLMSVEGVREATNRVKLETIVDAAKTNDSATLTAIPRGSSQGKFNEEGVTTAPDLKLDAMIGKKVDSNVGTSPCKTL